MAAHIELLGFPAQTVTLSTRIHVGLARFVEKLKSSHDLKRSLPLVSGERVVVTTCDGDGRWVAASPRALYHLAGQPPGSTDAPKWVRLGWEEISSASWEDTDCTLTLNGLVPTVARRTVLRLPSGRSLARLAQERVAWTEVVRTEIDLGDHGTVRVIGRRQPGSGELTWLVGLDSASDVAAPQGVIDAALCELRDRLGL